MVEKSRRKELGIGHGAQAELLSLSESRGSVAVEEYGSRATILVAPLFSVAWILA